MKASLIELRAKTESGGMHGTAWRGAASMASLESASFCLLFGVCRLLGSLFGVGAADWRVALDGIRCIYQVIGRV